MQDADDRETRGSLRIVLHKQPPNGLSPCRSMSDRLTELLDALDPHRYDTLELLDRLNSIEGLSDEAAEEEHFSIRECCHPFESLCGESHNEVLVIRDISGELAFIWQEDTRYQRYSIGSFCQGHVSELELDALAQHPEEGFGSLTYDRLLEAIDELPSAPGPLRRY